MVLKTEQDVKLFFLFEVFYHCSTCNIIEYNCITKIFLKLLLDVCVNFSLPLMYLN